RRRQQGTAVAGADGAQERVERDDGLPGADVALEQPLHRHIALEVGVDLRDRLELVRRELEREQRDVPLGELPRRPERRRTLGLALARAPRDRKLEREQLVEREPAAAALRLVQAPWPVEDGQRIRRERHAESLPQLGGKRIRK